MMAELTQEAQTKMAAFASEVPGLLGIHVDQLVPLYALKGKLETGDGMDQAVYTKLIDTLNANPDAAIAAMRQKIQNDPSIIGQANAHPNTVLPQLLSASGTPSPATAPVIPVAEISPSGPINPPGSPQPAAPHDEKPPAAAIVVATPEQKADFYLKAELDPAVAKARAALPEDKRAAFDADAQSWRQQVRDAVIWYENSYVYQSYEVEFLCIFWYSV
jgi:hypothetical protein